MYVTSRYTDNRARIVASLRGRLIHMTCHLGEVGQTPGEQPPTDDSVQHVLGRYHHDWIPQITSVNQLDNIGPSRRAPGWLLRMKIGGRRGCIIWRWLPTPLRNLYHEVVLLGAHVDTDALDPPRSHGVSQREALQVRGLVIRGDDTQHPARLRFLQRRLI